MYLAEFRRRGFVGVRVGGCFARNSMDLTLGLSYTAFKPSSNLHEGSDDFQCFYFKRLKI